MEKGQILVERYTSKLDGVRFIEYVDCPPSTIYNYEYVKENGIGTFFTYHYNISLFRSHILRGFYIQDVPYVNNQMLQCLEGSCQIVLLDLRDMLSTFGKTDAFTLGEQGSASLYIPSGVAYAVLSLTENTEIIGLSDTVISRLSTVMINPFDERLGIDWPDDVAASVELRRFSKKYDELEHYFW